MTCFWLKAQSSMLKVFSFFFELSAFSFEQKGHRSVVNKPPLLYYIDFVTRLLPDKFSFGILSPSFTFFLHLSSDSSLILAFFVDLNNLIILTKIAKLFSSPGF